MRYRDILVHVDSTSAGGARLALTISLAQRFDARLTGFHVVPDPDVRPLYKPSVVERVAEDYAKLASEAAERTEALFRDCAKSRDIELEYCKTAGNIGEQLRHAARFADLVVVGQSDTENPPGTSPFLLSEQV